MRWKGVLSKETYHLGGRNWEYKSWILPCLAAPLGLVLGFRSYNVLPSQWGIFIALAPFLLALLLSLVVERTRASCIRTAWGAELYGLILNGKIAPGMTTSQVEEAWGRPAKKEMLLISEKEGTLKFVYRGQAHEKRQLWFKDDRLVRVDS